MKTILYSDVHLRDRTSFMPWNKLDGNITKELSRIRSALLQLSELIKSEKPDLVLCLGDVFHNLTAIPSSVLYVSRVFNEIYQSCKSVGAEHWLIPGNHDFYGNQIYSIGILEGYYDRIFYSPVLDDNILYLPYFSDYSKAYEEILLDNPKLIFTHLTQRGAKVGNHRLDDGIDFPVKTYSGHIHQPQKVGKVRYVGSLVQLSYREGLEHGVLILEDDKERFHKIDVPQVVIIHSLEEIDNYPSDWGFILVSENIPDSLPSGIDIMVKPLPPKQKDSTSVIYEQFNPLEFLFSRVEREFPNSSELLREVLQ